MLSSYQSTFFVPGASLPAIMDEGSVLECVSLFSHQDITSLGELSEYNLPNVFLYEKQDGRKHLSIEEVRIFLSQIAERPYEGKSLFVFRDFDEATPAAMNALLKILEEPPEYAIILLASRNHENILETVRSRCLIFSSEERRSSLDDETRDKLKSFFHGDMSPFLQYLYTTKIERDAAIVLLSESIAYASGDMLTSLQGAMTDLFRTNESPRNILDRVYLRVEE